LRLAVMPRTPCSRNQRYYDANDDRCEQEQPKLGNEPRRAALAIGRSAFRGRLPGVSPRLILPHSNSISGGPTKQDRPLVHMHETLSSPLSAPVETKFHPPAGPRSTRPLRLSVYPAIGTWLERVASMPRHVPIDASEVGQPRAQTARLAWKSSAPGVRRTATI
jgi:hypothetical protein